METSAKDQPCLKDVMGKLDTLIVLQGTRGTHPRSNMEVLSDNQLADLLGRCKRSLQNYRSQGQLGYIKVGRKVMYRRSDVEEFMEQNYHEPFIVKTSKTKQGSFVQSKNQGYVGGVKKAR